MYLYDTINDLRRALVTSGFATSDELSGRSYEQLNQALHRIPPQWEVPCPELRRCLVRRELGIATLTDMTAALACYLADQELQGASQDALVATFQVLVDHADREDLTPAQVLTKLREELNTWNPDPQVRPQAPVAA
jgi:hypothetical protein